MDAGEYAGRPPPSPIRLVPALLGVAVLAALTAYAVLAITGVRAYAWAYAGVALAILAVSPLLPALRRPVLFIAASVAGLLAASLPVIPAAGAAYLQANEIPLLIFLTLAAAGTLASLLALSISMAAFVDDRRRSEALRIEPVVPDGFIRRDLAKAPRIADLDALAAELGNRRANGAVLGLEAQRAGGLWTLAPDVYGWLEAQPGPRRVHVEILEPDGPYHVPPILPEELDA